MCGILIKDKKIRLHRVTLQNVKEVFFVNRKHKKSAIYTYKNNPSIPFSSNNSFNTSMDLLKEQIQKRFVSTQSLVLRKPQSHNLYSADTLADKSSFS